MKSLRIRWRLNFLKISVRSKQPNAKNHHKNNMTQQAHKAFLENAQHRKKLRGQSEALKTAKISKNNGDVQTLICAAHSGTQILSVIQMHSSNIQHPSIYGKAMKECNKFKDWKSVQNIMQLLVESNLRPTVIEFT
eukprot:424143_1